MIRINPRVSIIRSFHTTSYINGPIWNKIKTSPILNRLGGGSSRGQDPNRQNEIRLDVTADELNRIRGDPSDPNSMMADTPPVTYHTAGIVHTKRQLPLNYRLAHMPIYMGPYAKQISLAKKISLWFGVFGIYASKIISDIDFLSIELSQLAFVLSILPYPLIQYCTSNYVVSIYRLHDKQQPQTLENLTKDEKFVVSKLNFSGYKIVDNLVFLKDLQTTDTKSSSKSWFSLPIFLQDNWYSPDPDNGLMRQYYVDDKAGGFKMDRIWGIVEKQSGIDNGRSFWADHTPDNPSSSSDKPV